MKTDFLKNLGITEQSVIDQIMAENGRDVNAAKGDLTALQTKVNDLEKDIKTKNATISDLQAKADSVDGLNQKISQLEADKTTLTNDLNTKVSEIYKEHAILDAIRDAKAINVKAVRALLDNEKITYEDGTLGGVTEQLTELAKAEDSSMLFGTATPTPSGTHVNNPVGQGNDGNPSTSNSLAEAVSKALAKN